MTKKKKRKKEKLEGRKNKDDLTLGDSKDSIPLTKNGNMGAKNTFISSKMINLAWVMLGSRWQLDVFREILLLCC